MAPTIKWQRWDSAAYNWLGQNATDALPSLEAELDAWITTVNANASNTGRQLAKVRGYASSTTTNYAGLTIEAGANNNADKGYLQYFSASTTAKKIYAGNTFADDTSNGGYGTVSGGSSDTGVSWATSGTEANFLLVYDTTDGQEFFSFGPTFGTTNVTSYQDGFFIFKATNGEWVMDTQDGSSHHMIHYWNTTEGWDNCNRATSADSIAPAGTYLYGRFALRKSSATSFSYTGQAGEIKSVVYAANPVLLETNTSSTYNQTGTRRVMTDLGDGTNVYVLTAYYYGPNIFIDLRS